MAEANNDEIFYKGKIIQEYSLAFKKEVIAYAEARGNQPASKQFSIDEKRVWEWRAKKSTEVCLDLPKESNRADWVEVVENH